MALDASKPLLAEEGYDAEAGHIQHNGEKDDAFRVPPLPHIGDGAAASKRWLPAPLPVMSPLPLPRGLSLHRARLIAEPPPSSLYGSEPDAALLREESERITEPEPVPEPITPANAKDRLHRWAHGLRRGVLHCHATGQHMCLASSRLHSVSWQPP